TYGSIDHLVLHDAPDFLGTIARFDTGDTIDVSGICFDQTTLCFTENSNGTGGILKILQDGHSFASFAFEGAYETSNFLMTDDHHGGILITGANINDPAYVTSTDSTGDELDSCGPACVEDQVAHGKIFFSDPNAADTHTDSFSAEASGYRGTFSL